MIQTGQQVSLTPRASLKVIHITASHLSCPDASVHVYTRRSWFNIVFKLSYLVEGPIGAAHLHRQPVHVRRRVPTTVPLFRRYDSVRVRYHPQLHGPLAVLRLLVCVQCFGWERGQRWRGSTGATGRGSAPTPFPAGQVNNGCLERERSS